MRLSVLVTLCMTVLATGALLGEDIDALIAKADTYYAEFDNKKAYDAYKQAYEARPKNAELLTKLTWSCNNVGEDLASDESETYFERATLYASQLQRLAPKQATTWFLKAITSGNLALYRGGKEKVRLSRHVEADAKKAIELDPDYSPAYAALGIYYREVAQLNWALKMVARHLLGGLPKGTLEDAENMLRTAIEKDHANVYAHYQLGLTYEAMGKENEAASQFRKVLELPVVDHQDPLFKKEARRHLRNLG